MADQEQPGPNPFGYADHSPFAAFGIELVYGLRTDGSLAHISQVPSGLACQCTCPACGRTLVARKGAIKIEHFSHHGAGNGCGRNAETNAHSWAKEVLGREKRILVPGVRATRGRDTVETYKPRLLEFATAELEKILDDIVPDVVLTTKDGKQLLVEVKVTHACGPEKIDKLKERRLPTIEIDMSAWRKSDDRQQIEEALVEWAARDWLFNAKQEDAEARLDALLAQRAAEAAEAERRREERAVADRLAREARMKRELDTKVARVRRAIAQARGSGSDAGWEEFEGVRRDQDLNALLMPSQPTTGFLVPNRNWQAALIDRVVKVTVGADFYLPEFGLDTVVRALEDCIPPLFRRDLPDDVRLALPQEIRSRLPRQAIEDFLYFLCDQGMLESAGADYFKVEESRARSLERQHARWQVRTRRQASIDRSMEKILQAIPPGERRDFSPETWRDRRIPGFARTLDRLVDEDEAVWSRFDQALLAIEKMIDGGDPISDTLGLPLGGELGRARERLRVKAVEAADAREQELRRAAQDAIGGATEAWLYTPPDADAPLALARNSEAGLAKALAALEEERKLATARSIAATLAERCRATLRIEAEKALGAEVATIFLRNHDAQLEASPWNICTDRVGLQRARTALASWQDRAKRARRGGVTRGR